MPTYDYECNACQHTFELFQGINDPIKRKCPECGRLKLRRLFGTGAAILFKGSGFYETDYRSDSYKKAASADKKAESKASEPAKSTSSSESKSDKKSESKPETTSTPKTNKNDNNSSA
jgi:putative FmdB family regulatory protein